MANIPTLIRGKIFEDQRGRVKFVNDFTFPKIKRFYIIETNQKREIRAWHAHRNEEKFIYVVSGEVVVAAIEIDDWNTPSKKNNVYKFKLNEKSSTIVNVPAGFANGLFPLSDKTVIVVFSTSTLEQSQSDDIRFPSDYWSIK